MCRDRQVCRAAQTFAELGTVQGSFLAVLGLKKRHIFIKTN
jgi:hypothetical protein